MKNYLLFILFLPFIVQGQDGLGIQFEEGKTWAAVVEKAKKENKFIFVDCFTTWCGPCKKMEKEVYTRRDVGEFLNVKFVSYKLQMDSTELDNEYVKKAHSDARYLEKKYDVYSYPTLMFFTPEGKILDKIVGQLNTSSFLKRAAEAIDSSKNYYSMLRRYNSGERELFMMTNLARNALNLIKDTVTAIKVANDYFAVLKKENWFTEDNIEFIRQFTNTSKDIGFSFFYREFSRVNKCIKQRNYSQNVVQRIVYKEMVLPALEKANQMAKLPDWEQMFNLIREKYGYYYADRVILSARFSWARKNREWKEYISYYIQYIEKYDPLRLDYLDNRSDFDALVWNNRAWEVFKHSEDTTQLIKALKWSNYAVMMDPQANWMDTYANILYKLGHVQLAITWESIAAALDPSDKNIQAALSKMKAGKTAFDDTLH